MIKVTNYKNKNKYNTKTQQYQFIVLPLILTFNNNYNTLNFCKRNRNITIIIHCEIPHNI